ncbi:MAG TPA: DeoR/GlpR family DNA-binding transcription regulator, partial [Acidobacteriota bacterium]|nr:DeoR/GlpR family DNA-binding transcription regulator [Acidobacteriota bacterium]
MKPEQRQDQILARLRAFQSEVSVEELASLFGVSALTIRRDLDQLDAQGAIVRTHGGCMLKSSIESAYRRRVATNFELKQAIGRAAADELQAAGTVLINDGSTTFHLAAHLGGRGSFTVFTNSIAIMTELSR